MESALSVIVPLFNNGQTIGRTLESLHSQPAFQNMEVLVVDDGSTDKGGATAEEYSSHHSNICVFHKKNCGLPSTYNLGTKQATGKYIAYLDADDTWEGSFYDSKLKETLKKSDIDIHGFSYLDVSPSGKWAFLHKRANTREPFQQHERGHYDWIHHCSFILHREFLTTNNLKYNIDSIGCEDRPFLDKCFFLANGCQNHDKLMLEYRSNLASCTHTINGIFLFRNTYASLVESRKWFAAYGEKYDIDYSVFMIFAQLLPNLCSEYSFQKVKTFIQETPELAILNDWKKYQFHRDLKKTITAWMHYPHLTWLKMRLLGRMKNLAKRMVLACPSIYPLAEFIWYHVFHKYRPMSTYH